MRRALRTALIAVAASALLLIGAAAWLAFTPSAAQWLVSQLVAGFEGRLTVAKVEGSLARGITLSKVVYRDEGAHIEIDQAQAAWEWSALLDFHARFRRLALGRVVVTTKPSTERAQLPQSLAVPLRVSVDAGRIDQLVISTAGGATNIDGIAFRGVADRTEHVLHAVSARAAQGRIDAHGRIEAHPPFALHMELEYSPDAGAALPAAKLTLGGSLREVEARFGATADWLVATGNAAIAPFEQVLVRRLAVHAEKVVPHERFAEAPQANLRGSIDLRQVAEDRFEGGLHLENEDPGTLDARKVPIATLAAQVSGNIDVVEIAALDVRMPRGTALTGAGRYADGTLALTLDTRGLDLKAWDTRMVATRLSGSVNLQANAQQQSVTALLTERDYRIETDLYRSGDVLTIKRATVAARGGTLTSSGEISLEPPHAFSAEGRLRRFDPSAFIESPRARINAEIRASGTITPQWSARLAIRADGTGPRNEAFSADARGTVGPGRVTDLHAKLAVGRNDLVATGAYGAPRDVLVFDAKLRALQDIDARFAGSLDAQGRISGDPRQPEVRLEASGSKLAAPGKLAIGALRLRAALPSDWNDALDLEVSASDVRIDDTRAGKVFAVVRGTPRMHRIEAAAEGRDVDARLRLAGGSSSMRAWAGEITELDVRSPVKAALLGPARLSLAPERIEVGSFTVVAMEARLAFHGLLWTPETFRTSGDFKALKIAPFVAAWSKTVRTTLAASGKWAIEERGGRLRGELDVTRDGGDVVLAGDTELPLALTALRVQARVENNRIRATAHAASAALGEFRAAVTTEAAREANRWVLPPRAPLTVEAQGDFSSIAWLGPLIDPSIAVAGTLTFRASGQGTVAAPRIDGTIEGKAISVRLPASGVALTDGVVRAKVADDRVLIEALRLKGGEGELTVQGEATLRKGTRANLRIDANKLMLVNRRDAQVEIDGRGDLIFGEGAIRLKGDVRVTQGHLDLLRKADMPTLAADIRIKKEKPAAAARNPLRFIVDLTTDFGDRFYVTAKGLGVGTETGLKPLSGDFKARISGRLHTVSNEKQVPQTTGRLTVVDGAYSALGRTFRVTRGNLNFSGPINNPVLDIFVAPAVTRLRFTPEVGISITGTALAPRVRLVSDPDMPETEKLSWLLFGRGGQKFDYAVGSTAAQIAAPVTELGWQLSEKLYVAYEQGATGTANIVRFYSQLTDRIAIEAGTGDASSLYLLYTFTLK